MRPPEVFVRELAPAEGQRLKRLSKQSKLASTRQRAMILLASNTLMSAPEIARMLLTDESHVRKVIHDFNRHGFESLRPRFGGGRPRRISIDDEARIVAVAGARPDTLGVPYTRWSLAKLSRYLRGQGLEVSPAQLGRILARNGISLQRTRSWKQSPDPEYEVKAARVLALYRQQPENGVVISFDEKGPESLCPKHGRGWARRGRPERHRATYNRRQGIRYLVGALDVHADYLRIRPRPRRNGASTLAFMKQIRLAYPEPDPPLLDPGRPLQPLDTRDPRLGGRQQHRARPDPDLRQLPEPDREHLRRHRRVRLQERRLPRLGRLRPRARRPRPLPQQPRRASAAQDRSRQAPPTPSRQNHDRAQARRLNNDRVSGATLREAALVDIGHAPPGVRRSDWLS